MCIACRTQVRLACLWPVRVDLGLRDEVNEGVLSFGQIGVHFVRWDVVDLRDLYFCHQRLFVRWDVVGLRNLYFCHQRLVLVGDVVLANSLVRICRLVSLVDLGHMDFRHRGFVLVGDV